MAPRIERSASTLAGGLRDDVVSGRQDSFDPIFVIALQPNGHETRPCIMPRTLCMSRKIFGKRDRNENLRSSICNVLNAVCHKANKKRIRNGGGSGNAISEKDGQNKCGPGQPPGPHCFADVLPACDRLTRKRVRYRPRVPKRITKRRTPQAEACVCWHSAAEFVL